MGNLQPSWQPKTITCGYTLSSIERHRKIEIEKDRYRLKRESHRGIYIMQTETETCKDTKREGSHSPSVVFMKINRQKSFTSIVDLWVGMLHEFN